MKSGSIDLGLTWYDELFMSTEERLDVRWTSFPSTS